MLIKTFLILTAAISISAMPEPTKTPERGKYAYLEIMHEQQSPDLCLPTCVAMVLNYYGDGKSQYTIKRLSNEHKDLFSATGLDEIRDGIKKIGYTWDRWRWPGDSTGVYNGIDAIEQSLDDGRPVIVSIKVTIPNYHRKVAHAIIAFGYDASEREIFFMDPAKDFPGKRHISFEEFRDLWNEDGSCWALFTAPHGEMPTGHRK
jgi:ABC-type bacteriocin/lantibiotic exporter with double-glycine peptidase domain